MAKCKALTGSEVKGLNIDFMSNHMIVTQSKFTHEFPLTGKELFCCTKEADVCEQLAEGRYVAVERPCVEPATS